MCFWKVREKKFKVYGELRSKQFRIISSRGLRSRASTGGKKSSKGPLEAIEDKIKNKPSVIAKRAMQSKLEKRGSTTGPRSRATAASKKGKKRGGSNGKLASYKKESTKKLRGSGDLHMLLASADGEVVDVANL